ncbi:MAG TPA: hypothetical protein VKU94_01140 [Geobacterales bacterium]|nr:hypothetical protein [Geobacterales bacterium]
MMEEISDELFKRGLERAKMLDPVIKDIKTFSNEGLNKYEILELIKNIKNLIKKSSENSKFPILDLIEWSIKNLSIFISDEEKISLEKFRQRINNLPISDFRIFQNTNLLGKLIFKEPIPTFSLKEMINEMTLTFNSIVDDFSNLTQFIISTLGHFTPEAYQALIKFFDDRTISALGESLCIWWLINVRSLERPIWRTTFGPIFLGNIEFDAFAIGNNLRIGFAEIKITRNSDKLEEGINQLRTRIQKFNENSFKKSLIGYLKQREIKLPGIEQLENVKEIEEVCLITTMELKEEQTKNRLKEKIEKSNVKINEITILDYIDIQEGLKNLKYKNKTVYIEMFEKLKNLKEYYK